MATGTVTSAPPQGRPIPPAAPQGQPVAQAAPVIPQGQPVAQTAPPPQPTGPAGENGEQPRKRRGRKRLADETRVYHPSLNVDAEGKAQNLLDSAPEDYDTKQHLPLRRRDFKDDSTFLIWKAERLEKEAAECRKEAEQLSRLGGKDAQQNARKLATMVSKVDELTKQFEAQGIDVAALIAKMQEKTAQKAQN